MTDNDIIKALECCGIKNDCTGCYFNTHEAENICTGEIIKNAFGIINRQRKEIERLKKYNTEVAYKHYNDGIKEFAGKLKEKVGINFIGKYHTFPEIVDELLKEYEK